MKNTKFRLPETENENLNIYFKQIQKHSSFNYEEEKALALRIQKGDKKAENELILGNLRFVVSVVKKYQNRGLPLSDLINIGNIGLIKAARRFDYRKNFKFISYAVWWIRQQVLQALADQSRWTRVPLNKVPLFEKYNKTYNRLQQKHGREPETQEVMSEMGMDSDSEYQWLISLYAPSYSLERPIGDTNDTIKDRLVDHSIKRADEFIEEDTNKKLTYELLNSLSEREREICKLYYGIEDGYTHTLEEIGTRLNLTRERVRQIKDRAMKQLYHYANLINLKEDLVEA
jgi:RNA polymerase primary sigma factor